MYYLVASMETLWHEDLRKKKDPEKGWWVELFLDQGSQAGDSEHESLLWNCLSGVSLENVSQQHSHGTHTPFRYIHLQSFKPSCSDYVSKLSDSVTK